MAVRGSFRPRNRAGLTRHATQGARRIVPMLRAAPHGSLSPDAPMNLLAPRGPHAIPAWPAIPKGLITMIEVEQPDLERDCFELNRRGCWLTSPRLRGEVGLRSNPGEGDYPRVRSCRESPSPRPSPRKRGATGKWSPP